VYKKSPIIGLFLYISKPGIPRELNNNIMMQKTLGGDRLGSGKKMKVDLHGYERSTHNLSYLWKSTMSVGTLIPFIEEYALPGDTFDIDLDMDIKTLPAIGPLFGSFKAQADVFMCPIRLYMSALHNNALNIGRKMEDIKIPQMFLIAKSVWNPDTDEPPTDVDNCQINPSCLLKYLGISGVVLTEVQISRAFNAMGVIALWDTYKNYYANKQEEIGAYIHTPITEINETVDSIFITTAGIPVALDNPPAEANIPLDSSTQFEINPT